MIEPENPVERFTVRFSPRGHCEDLLVALIDDARLSLRAMIYALTADRIARAFARAVARGVPVDIMADYGQATQPSSKLNFLQASGCHVLVDAREKLHHHKVLIVDDKHIVCGSYNWTDSADDRNAEDMLYLPERPLLVRRYLAEMSCHAFHCHPWAAVQYSASHEFGPGPLNVPGVSALHGLVDIEDIKTPAPAETNGKAASAPSEQQPGTTPGAPEVQP